MAMMEVPLNSWLLLDNVVRNAGDTEVVSQIAPGVLHRYTYADFAKRTQQLMHALDALGLEDGDRVGDARVERLPPPRGYFAIPCTGRVLHTLNLRLSPEDLAYIIGHADDRVILVDPDLLPLLEKIGDGLANVKHIIVLADEVPQDELAGIKVTSYEAPDRDRSPPNTHARTSTSARRSASATRRARPAVRRARCTRTGRRSCTRSRRRRRPASGSDRSTASCRIVPMFHANAWGIPFAAVAVGAKQVFAGAL